MNEKESKAREWHRKRMTEMKYPSDIEYCKKCTDITKSGKEITTCIVKENEHCPNTWKGAIYAPKGY